MLFFTFFFFNPAARERLGNLHQSERAFWIDTGPHMGILQQDLGQYVTLKKNNWERDMNHS